MIFPVAGGAGTGAFATAQASNGAVSVLWVDTDGCVSLPDDCQYILSSVTKGLTTSVQTYLKAAATGDVPDRLLHRHAGQ